MAYYIKRVYKGGRNFRVNIPMKIIREKGWEDVLYIKIEDHWGDRILISRVSDDEESKADDKSDPG